MALVLANRVQETTTTTGTGTVTLAGAMSGFQSFAVVGNTNTTYYAITSGTAWEVGIGTYSTTGPTLARTTILSSSIGGGAITLAGTSIVFSSYPAEKVISDGYGLLPVANGGTGTTTAFTAGSVVFAGASGVYSQDNANLFWDDANDRLGIGTSSPSSKLSVIGTINASDGTNGNVRTYVDGTAAYLQSLNQAANAYRPLLAMGSTVSFANNGVTNMILDTNGNLQLGPSAAFSIAGTKMSITSPAATNTYVSIYGGTGSTNGGILLGGNNAENFANLFYSTSSNYLQIAATPVGSAIKFDTAGAERMRITSAGFVGIGTSSPQVGLHVVFADQSTNRIRLQNTGASGGNFDIIGGIAGASNVGLSFYDVTNAATRMYIDSSGNVGIGVASPVERLDVAGNAKITSGSSFYWGDATAQITAVNAGAMRFLVGNGGEKMRIDGTGEVGIGTSSPGAKLDVNGTIWARASAAAIGMDVIGRSADNAGQIRFLNNAANTTLGTLTSYGNDVALLNNTASFSLLLGTNGTERMRINSTGNVMVGTTTDYGARLTLIPATTPTTFAGGNTLQIGEATNNTAYRLQMGYINHTTAGYVGSIQSYAGGVANNLILQGDGGNVGIGTASPGAKLDVVGNAYVRSGVMYSDTFTAYSGANLSINAGAGFMAFATSATERMRIDSSGNVGIGTSSPSQKLTVQGAQLTIPAAGWSAGQVAYNYLGDTNGGIKATNGGNVNVFAYNGFDVTVNGPSPVTVMTITAGANVGIGTSSPAQKLDVNGNINFGNTLTGGSGVSTGDCHIEIGGNRSGNGNAYIDLHSVAGTDYESRIIRAAGTNGQFNITNTGTGAMVFDTNNTERARIDSTGKMQVGTTSSSYAGALAIFEAEGGSFASSLLSNTGGVNYATLYVYNKSTSGNNELVQFGTEGTWTGRGSITYNRTAGLTAYNTTSDYRAKDILGPVTDAGATIDALKVYNGKMKGATSARPMLIAHEAQEVTPYAVTGEKDAVNEDGVPKFQQMDVSSLVPLLIAEIQSLRARVAQLEGK